MANIELKNISKVYRSNVKAVSDISLNIEAGQLAVILGPSGCGKSTILRLIAGLEKADAGSISIDGNIVDNILPENRNIAMVFQTYQLYPHINVENNIAFALKMNNLSKSQINARIDDAAEALDITHLLKRMPHTLSGGQKQLVAIAKTIVREPAICLFDEPLSNLDAQVRVDIRNKIRHLHHKRNWTTLYVTHDQDEAMAMAQNIFLMNKGTIIQAGTPFEIYNKPANRFAGEFIGSPPMNFFGGTVRKNNGSIAFMINDSISVTLKPDLDKDKYLDQKTILGIRPEDIELPDNNCSENTIKAKIQSLEFHGHRMIVYLKDFFGNEFAVNTKVQTQLKPGDNITLWLNHKKTHIFFDQ
ncbi:MAG: ABC transporter ATP-binding protein [Phycisphaerae bacterium]|nr:ABC transporter ATP-binding protein [Phycisphaerae bacterium]